MMRTFTARGADPDVMAWATEHGLDPHNTGIDVGIDDEGRVHVETRSRRNQPFTKKVVITPKRPFPYAPSPDPD